MFMMIFLHKDHEDNGFFNRKKQQGLLIHLDNGTTLKLLQQNKYVMGRGILFNLGWQSFSRWCLDKNTGVEAP